MNSIPVPLAGAITIALIVVLGVFIYPWLLHRRLGAPVVALVTLVLAVLFFLFTDSATPTIERAIWGAAWSLAALLAGIIVWRIQRKAAGPR